MRRRLFTLASILSLLLCVATVALWVRSYWVDEAISFIRNDAQNLTRTQRGLESDAGQLSVFDRFTDVAANPRMANFVKNRGMPHIVGWWYVKFRADAEEWKRRLWAFDFSFRAHETEYDRWSTLSIPHWLAAGIFATLPMTRLRSRWRKHWRSGLCPQCGYDLRATPDRCPECGTVPGPARAVAHVPENST